MAETAAQKKARLKKEAEETKNDPFANFDWEKIGTNIHTIQNGKFTYFRVDMKGKRWESESGKSNNIASTRGNKELEVEGESNIFAGINVYQRKK